MGLILFLTIIYLSALACVVAAAVIATSFILKRLGRQESHTDQRSTVGDLNTKPIDASNDRRRFKFGLRSLFWITAIVAVVAYIPTMLYREYYRQLSHVNEVLLANSEIENVRIEGNEDAFYEAEWVEFSIAGKPGSKVALVIPHAERIDGGTKLWLSQLGPWSFTTFGHGYNGVYRSETGEPIKTDFNWSWINVGSDGPFAALIPVKANTVADIVDHYDELVEFFEMWPKQSTPGKVQDRSGTLLHYYAAP
jgi:hypothetical protein